MKSPTRRWTADDGEVGYREWKIVSEYRGGQDLWDRRNNRDYVYCIAYIHMVLSTGFDPLAAPQLSDFTRQPPHEPQGLTIKVSYTYTRNELELYCLMSHQTTCQVSAVLSNYTSISPQFIYVFLSREQKSVQ